MKNVGEKVHEYTYGKSERAGGRGRASMARMCSPLETLEGSHSGFGGAVAVRARLACARLRVRTTAVWQRAGNGSELSGCSRSPSQSYPLEGSGGAREVHSGALSGKCAVNTFRQYPRQGL